MLVFVRTIESYCSVIQAFDAIDGEASKRRKFSVRSVPSAANFTSFAAGIGGAEGAAIGRL
jgi:hypothetical protein